MTKNSKPTPASFLPSSYHPANTRLTSYPDPSQATQDQTLYDPLALNLSSHSHPHEETPDVIGANTLLSFLSPTALNAPEALSPITKDYQPDNGHALYTPPNTAMVVEKEKEKEKKKTKKAKAANDEAAFHAHHGSPPDHGTRLDLQQRVTLLEAHQARGEQNAKNANDYMQSLYGHVLALPALLGIHPAPNGNSPLQHPLIMGRNASEPSSSLHSQPGGQPPLASSSTVSETADIIDLSSAPAAHPPLPAATSEHRIALLEQALADQKTINRTLMQNQQTLEANQQGLLARLLNLNHRLPPHLHHQHCPKFRPREQEESPDHSAPLSLSSDPHSYPGSSSSQQHHGAPSSQLEHSGATASSSKRQKHNSSDDEEDGLTYVPGKRWNR